MPEEWSWVIDKAKQLIGELPLGGSKRLDELWKMILERWHEQAGPRSPLDELRQLLLRLCEHSPHYRVFGWQNDIPWTNNGTEQVVRHMKVRSRTVRGYKSKAGLLAGLLVGGSSVC